ncbi:hypothetical protein [Sphingomonas sp.]|uniref:hypothetical protein n=1 Tax=Sphingomonas sp. TaxID=28214 RepID=UPI002DE948A7|nr:hypothetical protein [Sphingomonas sp.]
MVGHEHGKHHIRARDFARVGPPCLRSATRWPALDPGRLAVLQEICAPTARLWLPARWEGSPLAETRAFGTDDGSAKTFGGDLRAFHAAEASRGEVLERTPDALAIEDPEPYRAWATAHGRTLLGLDVVQRERLARWLDRFAGAAGREPGSTAAPVELAELERAMLALPADDAPTDALEVARLMEDAELEQWLATSDRLARRPGLLEGLSPGRWMAAWRRRGLMNREGLCDGSALGAALHREIGLRPLRSRLVRVTTEVGEPCSLSQGR